MIIKRIITNLFLGLLFCTPLTVLAQNSFIGDWKMQIPDETGKLMDLKVSIKSDAKLTVDFGNDGTLEVEGKYVVEGDQITFEDISGPNACLNQKGIYKFVVTETTFVMTRVSDACEGRGGPEGKMAFTRIK